MKKVIEDIDDIWVFADEFYTRVKTDNLLAPYLGKRLTIGGYISIKCTPSATLHFFGVPGFRGSPFARHVPLKIGSAHFDRRLELFYITIDERSEGFIAEDAKKRAELMANIFLYRLQQQNGNSNWIIV